MSNPCLYRYNLAVVALCGAGVIIAVQLCRSSNETRGRSVMRAAAWLASGALLARGAGGLVVDGTSDPIWWPTFLIGGILFGTLAWSARAPRRRA
jgi:hypothetical protein